MYISNILLSFQRKLKVLSYWNLNFGKGYAKFNAVWLKVLSYWNLNVLNSNSKNKIFSLKYYHIEILLQKK